MYILYNTFSYLQAGNIENVVVQDIKFTFRAIVLEKYEKKHIIQNVLCILHNPVESEYVLWFFAFGGLFFIILSFYSKKTQTSKVGDELGLLPT